MVAVAVCYFVYSLLEFLYVLILRPAMLPVVVFMCCVSSLCRLLFATTLAVLTAVFNLPFATLYIPSLSPVSPPGPAVGLACFTFFRDSLFVSRRSFIRGHHMLE